MVLSDISHFDCGRQRSEKAAPQRLNCGLRAVGRGHLIENIVNVAFDGTECDVQAFTDLVITDAIGYQAQHFEFAGTQGRIYR